MTPSTSEDQALRKTRNNLKLLGIFYILFGFAALPGLLLIGVHHVIIEKVVSSMESMYGIALELDLEPLLRVLMWGIITLVIVHLLSFVWVGLCFSKQTNYVACFIAAIFCCMSPPLGTVLGIFSLINLNSPEGKKLFGREN